ncbi:MAG TPA: hypothetical protein VMT93_05355 [Gemmatimonadaceae bacterium]|nr:hypothetical protein [Gemmatimonadaceae bacterium]
MNAREAELAALGWTRRFVVAPARIDEFVGLYEALGYDVRLEKPEPQELREECGGCLAAVMLFRTLYTRHRA